MNIFLHGANDSLDDIYEYILNIALNVMLQHMRLGKLSPLKEVSNYGAHRAAAGNIYIIIIMKLAMLRLLKIQFYISLKVNQPNGEGLNKSSSEWKLESILCR
jgi:hypothetical protein